jgi:hypothetical protein
MDDFARNPCRHHLFEVFALDKSETDLRAILAATLAARDRLRFGKMVAGDGAELQISEAELNRLEQVLLSPVARLEAEQLVHQAHSFARDPGLAACLARLAHAAAGDPLAAELELALQRVLLLLVRAALPPLPPVTLADDLPWPPAPETSVPRRESPAAAALRDA